LSIYQRATISPWRYLEGLFAVVRLAPHDTSSEWGRSRERYRRAALSTLASLVSKSLAIGVGLVTVPLALSFLGTERFGLWMTISSLTAILAFADFGIGNGLLTAIAEASGQDREDLTVSYISSAFFVLSSVALVLGGLLVLAYPFIPWGRVFNLSTPESIAEAGTASMVFLACTLISIPLDVAVRVRMGYQEGFINSLWDAIGSVLGLCGLLVAIVWQAGLPWLVLASAGGPVVSTAINAVTLVLKRLKLRPRWSAVRAPATKHILRMGVVFALLQAAVAAVYLSDNLIVTQIFGPESVAGYSVHVRMFGLAPFVVNLAQAPLWPAYGEAIARGEIPWVKRTLVRSMLATLAFVGGVSAVLILIGPHVLRLWLGTDVSSSLPLLVGLAISSVLLSVGNAVAVFLNGANILRAQLVLACLMAVAAVILKIALAYRLGISGVVWGTVAAYLLFTALPFAVLLPRILRRLHPPVAAVYS
jgi:O-antigen/teichoic acid export membrane protein